MSSRPSSAAALAYERGMPAPLILASGRGAMAERIKEIAEAHGIPVATDVALADDLVDAEPGSWLPEHLWQVVAEILAFLGTLETGR